MFHPRNDQELRPRVERTSLAWWGSRIWSFHLRKRTQKKNLPTSETTGWLKTGGVLLCWFFWGVSVLGRSNGWNHGFSVSLSGCWIFLACNLTSTPVSSWLFWIIQLIYKKSFLYVGPGRPQNHTTGKLSFAQVSRLCIDMAPHARHRVSNKTTSHTVVKRKVIKDPTSPTSSNFKQQELNKSTSNINIHNSNPFPKQFPQPDLFNRQLRWRANRWVFSNFAQSPRLEQQNLAKTQIRWRITDTRSGETTTWISWWLNHPIEKYEPKMGIFPKDHGWKFEKYVPLPGFFLGFQAQRSNCYIYPTKNEMLSLLVGIFPHTWNQSIHLGAESSPEDSQSTSSPINMAV